MVQLPAGSWHGLPRFLKKYFLLEHELFFFFLTRTCQFCTQGVPVIGNPADCTSLDPAGRARLRDNSIIREAHAAGLPLLLNNPKRQQCSRLPPYFTLQTGTPCFGDSGFWGAT